MTRRTKGRSHARVVSINIGTVRTVESNGRAVRSAIWKSPVPGRVRLDGVNVEGDQQADRSVHGGPDKAVYAYATEDLAWWTDELGRDVGPGMFGENLTTLGIDLRRVEIGERWAVGSAVLEVSQPRTPCYKLGIRMGDPRFPARFAVAGRPGAYLRIVTPGGIEPGDAIRVLSRPGHGLTVGDVERAYHADRTLVRRLLDVPQLPESWVAWARHVLEMAGI
jgi:MOSC domain-containing protein YiiM